MEKELYTQETIMNQTWIKADIDLGAPEALFVLPMLDAHQLGVMELLRRYDDPEVTQRNLNLLEGGVRAVFGEFRPELAIDGGTVLSVSAEMFHNWLLIMYSHPRLPRRPTKQTKMMDRYWLIPRPGSDEEKGLVFGEKIKTEVPGTMTIRRDFDIPLRPVVRGYLEAVESVRQFKEGWEDKVQGVMGLGEIGTFTSIGAFTSPDGVRPHVPILLQSSRNSKNGLATLPIKDWLGPSPGIPITGADVAKPGGEAKILTPIPLDLYQDRDLPKHPRWEDFLCWLYDHQASGRLTEENRRRLFDHFLSLKGEWPGSKESKADILRAELESSIPEDLF